MDRLSDNWYVLHLKPRCEKKASVWFSAFRLLSILPLRTEVRKVQRRRVEVKLPIFPGYIFVRMPSEKRLEVLQSNAVVRFIPVPDPRTLVHQLHQVIKAARVTDAMALSPVYTEGDAVRIKYGPMKGVEGRFKRVQGKDRLVLNVEMLGQAVEITVDALDCRKA